MMQDTVLYDKDCGLCRSLAAFAEQRSEGRLKFQASQDEGHGEPADRLRVQTATGLLEGDQAWAYLLETYRDLAALNWLAAKLGLTTRAARLMNSSGSFVKRLCRKCGGRPLAR